MDQWMLLKMSHFTAGKPFKIKFNAFQELFHPLLTED